MQLYALTIYLLFNVVVTVKSNAFLSEPFHIIKQENSTDGKCTKIDEYCNSWYSTIVVILKSETTDKEFEDIKSVMRKTFTFCQNLGTGAIFGTMTVYSHSTPILTCQNVSSCSDQIKKLQLTDVLIDSNAKGTWRYLYEKYSSVSQMYPGFVSFIITNINCADWPNSEMGDFLKYGDKVSKNVLKYNVITKLIRIMDELENNSCNILSIINESQNLVDVISLTTQNAGSLEPKLVGLCGDPDSNNGYYFAKWPNSTSCSNIGGLNPKCKTWSVFFFIALSLETSKDELLLIKTLINKIIMNCLFTNSYIYIYTSNSMPPTACSASSEDCTRKVNYFSLTDLYYDKNSPNQIDYATLVNSVRPAIRGHTDGSAFYIVSNLNNSEFDLSTHLMEPLVYTGTLYGYVLYRNFLNTRLIDIGARLEAKTYDQFFNLFVSSNQYFDVYSIKNLSTSVSKSSNDLALCYTKPIASSNSQVRADTKEIIYVICIVFAYLLI